MEEKKMNFTKNIMTIEAGATEKLQTAITNSGDSFISILATIATVISLITSSIAGICLLVLCISTAWKSRRGNEDAWGDAMQLIATVAAILCFSTAVMAIFF